MKKKVLSLLLVGAMAASMAVGCGGNSDGDSQSTNDSQSSGDSQSGTSDDSQASQDGDDGQASDNQGGEDGSFTVNQEAIDNLKASTSGPVNIDLWCAETEVYQTIMKTLTEEFAAAYPEIEFNFTIGAVSEADAKDRILEDAEAAADVYVFAADQINELVKAGAIQEVVTTYTYDIPSASGEAIVDAATVGGKLYAYPLTASNGYFLYYNSSELSADDVSSWENLIAAAEAKNKQVGMDIGNAWYTWGFFAGAGLPTSRDETTDNTSCDWNNETGVAVAEAIQQYCSSSAVISISDADAQAKVKDGDLIAYVDGVWAEQAFKDAYGDGYAATKLPTFTAGGTVYQQASFGGYKFVGVNAHSENTGWSMLLAEFLTNEANQKRIAEAVGESPCNIAAASQAKTTPALEALAEQAEFSYLESKCVGGKFWDPVNSLGASLVEGGVTDMQALLDEAVAGVTQPAE